MTGSQEPKQQHDRPENKERDKIFYGTGDKRTDVLYLSTYAHSGGMSIAANRIHLGLRSIGINSKMLSMRANPSNDNRSDNIFVVRQPEGEKWDPNYNMFPANNIKFDSSTKGIDIGKYIDAFDPQIVQIHWVSDNFVSIEDIGKITGRKVIWRLAECLAFTGGCYFVRDCERYKVGCGRCPRLRSSLENDLSRSTWLRKQAAFNNIDLTIVVPTTAMRKLVENSPLMRDRKIAVIPNGLDLRMFYPEDKAAAREELGIPPDKKVIIFGAANVKDRRKGGHLLEQAMSKLMADHKDEYHMVVFGGGSDNMDFDIPTTGLGFIRDKNRQRTAYSAADVMIVPSLEEPFGQTVTEAMACGAPVVTFRNTGPEDMVDHKETGWLSDYADPDDLAAGIEWVLEDGGRLKTLSENARAKVETTYDIKIIADQYKKLYEELLRK